MRNVDINKRFELKNEDNNEEIESEYEGEEDRSESEDKDKGKGEDENDGKDEIINNQNYKFANTKVN